jgi:hypothetical protein
MLFFIKSKVLKNILYLFIKSAVREYHRVLDESEYDLKTPKTLIVETRRLVSQLIILEFGIVNNLLPKAVKQEHEITFCIQYIKYGIFKHLIDLYDTNQNNRQNISSESPIVLRFEDEELPSEEHSELSKILELLASQKDGLEILNDNLMFVMEKLLVFLSEDSDVKNVICPASTVLLDLTANAPSLEIVANFMHQNRMLIYVINKTKTLLERSTQELNVKEHEFRNKIRDLYIGIILNLT